MSPLSDRGLDRLRALVDEPDLSGTRYEPYCDYAQGLGVPVFRSADRAVRMYRRYLEYILV